MTKVLGKCPESSASSEPASDPKATYACSDCLPASGHSFVDFQIQLCCDNRSSPKGTEAVRLAETGSGSTVRVKSQRACALSALDDPLNFAPLPYEAQR